MSSSTLPAVRAAYMQNLLSILEARGLREILDRGGLAGEIEAASRLAWLPVTFNISVVEAICAELGEEPGLELLAVCVHEQFETPLWSGFVGPAIRLLGREPGGLGRWIPKALDIMFRNCGAFSISPDGDATIVIEAHGLPDSLCNHRLWLRSLGIGFRALFAICTTPGTSDLESFDPEGRTARYRLTWKSEAMNATAGG